MQCKKINVALICFDNPYLPPAEGGKRGIKTRIESLLLSEQYNLDIYLMNKRSEGMVPSFGDLEKKARSIHQYQMGSSLSTFLSPYPICVNKRYVKACAQDLKDKHYDIAIYEGPQVSKYRFKNVVNADYHILYMHDIESSYRAEIARSQRGILRIANAMESKRFKRIEKKIDGYFDRVWYISKEECCSFSEGFKDPSKGTYIPFPALQIVNAPVIGSKAPRMLYVGDLSILHNYLSVEWFAREVLPAIKGNCPDAELMVIGRISESDSKTLTELGANVCGYVDDLDAAYKEAACIVAPVLFGAGVKAKTIDAIAQGQIVITTSKGIEGTELECGTHLLVEDDPIKLSEICCNVLIKRTAYEYLAQQGLVYIKQVHTIEHQASIINQEIDLLIGS